MGHGRPGRVEPAGCSEPNGSTLPSRFRLADTTAIVDTVLSENKRTSTLRLGVLAIDVVCVG